MKTIILFQLTEAGSVNGGIYKEYGKDETVVIPKIGDTITLKIAQTQGYARVLSIEDKTTSLPGKEEHREITLYLTR